MLWPWWRGPCFMFSKTGSQSANINKHLCIWNSSFLLHWMCQQLSMVYTFQMFLSIFVVFLWNIEHMMDDLLPLLGWLKWLAMAPRPAFMTWRQLCLLCSNLTSPTCEYHMSYHKWLQALLAYQTQCCSSRETELSVNSQKCWREFKFCGLWIYENAEKPPQQLAE